MERRGCLRGRTDFSVLSLSGFGWTEARGIELSGSGLVLDRGRPASETESVVVRLEIVLPEQHRAIVAVARPVRSHGQHLAFRFVTVSEVDRLCLAEHLDLVHRRGGVLH